MKDNIDRFAWCLSGLAVGLLLGLMFLRATAAHGDSPSAVYGPLRTREVATKSSAALPGLNLSTAPGGPVVLAPGHRL